MKVKGVRQVVKLSDAVAVVADHTGAARKGLAVLDVSWTLGANASLTTEELERRADEAMVGEALVHLNEGDVATTEAAHERGINADYRLPDPASHGDGADELHGPRSPRRCDIWVGTQVGTRPAKPSPRCRAAGPKGGASTIICSAAASAAGSIMTGW